MSLLSLSTSHAPNSLNYRGLLVLNELTNMGTIDGLHNYDIPVVNVNGMDEKLPPDVKSKGYGMRYGVKYINEEEDK